MIRPALIGLCFLAGLLAACNKTWAPVEERSSSRTAYKLTADGQYRVRSGDSLHAIAFNFGLDWRDIAAWNNIRAPYTIFPDQELRLSAPAGQPSAGASTAAPAPDRAPAATSTGAAKTTVSAAPAKRSSSKEYSEPAARASSVSTADPARWQWPADGRILSNFKANDPARNGIDIAGKEGQAIVATAAGEVVYSGNGLIGYGELIIVKHSERMLSAYAHNRKRLVAEGDRVESGGRIAEMGRNDRNQAMLHFEIRRDGKPQDPLKYLPPR